MAFSFSNEDDDVLVDQVANNPALWLISHPFYREQRFKENIWSEISNKIGKPVGVCKKRWRNIKDTYDRRINKSKRLVKPSKPGKRWILAEKLTFLLSPHRRRYSRKPTEKKPQPGPELPQPSTEPPPLLAIKTPDCNKPKQKPINRRTTQLSSVDNPTKSVVINADSDDDIDLFFKSLAKTAKKLTPQLQQLAKAETLKVICALESEMWTHDNYEYEMVPTNESASSTSRSLHSDVKIDMD